MKNRLDKWNEKHYYPLMTLNIKESSDFKLSFKIEETDEVSLLLEFIKMSKELVFDIKDNKPIFHCIMRGLDESANNIYFENKIDLIPIGETKDEWKSESLSLIACAISLEVPIIPNNQTHEKLLVELYKDLIENGFQFPVEKNNSIVLQPVGGLNTESIQFSNIEKLSINRNWSPGEIGVIITTVLEELRRISSAYKTLTLIKIGIARLENLLKSVDRNENELQRCLTENPILLGLEYIDMKPKFKLGAEYEMDYALIRHDGNIDILEIEASTHELFTKKGSPRQELIHSEQQILDWLEWLESNNSYANRNVKGFVSPKGIIIIGRDFQMTDEEKKKLIRRNKTFGEKIIIYTYDDILRKAKNILRILEFD